MKNQAWQYTTNQKTFLEKDHLDLTITTELDTNTKKEKFLPGNTVTINFESNGFIDATAEGLNLLIAKMEWYTDGTNDFAKMYLTNKTSF